MSVRVGVVGAGWWATRAHLPALESNPAADVVAIADPDGGNRHRAAQQFGVERTFDSVDAMLDSVALDAAVVAVPHIHHTAVARRCLEQGLHVLIEKPMTIDPADAVELLELARRVEREIVVGYPWHYNAHVLELRARLAAGVIGAVEAVACLFASVARELYRGRPEQYRDVLGYTLNAPGAATYSDAAVAGGGQGQTQLTHAAALVVWLTGLELEAVAAFTADHGLAVDLADAVSARFTGGAVGTFMSTGSIVPSQAELLEVRLFGQAGHVSLDLMAGTAAIHRDDGTIDRLPVLPDVERYPEWAPAHDLVAVADGRSRNGSPGGMGAHVVAFIDAMYRSARSGRVEALVWPGAKQHSPRTETRESS